MRFVGIDLSTKTGLVILDESGNVLTDVEITSRKKDDPERMIELTKEIMSYIEDEDIIYIEGFSYGSRGRGVSFQFGFGYSVRTALMKDGIEYTIVAPGQLKKFATGKGNTSKDNMILPIYRRWGYESKSDNIRDAYVLARIAEAVHKDVELTKYQLEVLDALENKS